MMHAALAPRPTVCARPTRAFSTWRGARLAAQLVHELDDLPERRRAERLALRQQAAARVHDDARLGEELRLVAGRAEIELLVREQLAGGVGVLALDDVEVVGPDARLPRTRRARRASTAE